VSMDKPMLKNLPQGENEIEKVWLHLARIFIVAGAIGWFASAALLVERVQSLKNPSKDLSCDISPFVSCGPLFDRWQASLFGFPNAILGVAGFVIPIVIGVGILAGARFKPWFWRFVVIGMAVAWFFVTWLFTQSVYDIGVLCPYCLVVWLSAIPMWWTALIVTFINGYWGSRVRNLVSRRGTSLILVCVIFNYVAIALLISLEMGDRIVSSL
jgi:uncharacterized membrane protein